MIVLDNQVYLYILSLQLHSKSPEAQNYEEYCRGNNKSYTVLIVARPWAKLAACLKLKGEHRAEARSTFGADSLYLALTIWGHLGIETVYVVAKTQFPFCEA